MTSTAGAVTHLRPWRWCGYHELVGQRQRYRLLDLDGLLPLLEIADQETLAWMHARRVAEEIDGDRFDREEVWTESIAVGSESFVRTVVSQTKRRKRLLPEVLEDGTWFVRDPLSFYYRAADYS